MKLISGIVVAAIFAVVTFGLWAYLNRPESEPPWPAHGIQGVAFSPYAADQNPFGSKDVPPVEQIDSDLKLLENKTLRCARTPCKARSARFQDWPRSTTSASHWVSSCSKRNRRTSRSSR